MVFFLQKRSTYTNIKKCILQHYVFQGNEIQAQKHINNTEPTCPTSGEAKHIIVLVPSLLVASHHPRLVHRGPLQALEVQLAGVVERPVLNGRGRGLGPGRHTLGPVLHAEGVHGAV